jgi:hypothetical protein
LQNQIDSLNCRLYDVRESKGCFSGRRFGEGSEELATVSARRGTCMGTQRVCLAAVEGLGQVYDCGDCGNIHIQIGPVSITVEPHAYMQFVAMLSTSAANFEMWLERRSGPPAGDGVEPRHQFSEEDRDEPGGRSCQ